MDEVDGAEGKALEQAAWEVYGVAPADFVPTRTRWVKELRSRRHRDAAKAVAALRKPSVSAAAINTLVRAGDPVVDRLRDLGTRLRHAQSALDGPGLAGLRGERDEVLQGWVAAAQQHAPGPLTDAAAAEVRDTAVAALADGAATEAALSGTLTRALSYSGFGEVDISDAVARTSTGVVLTRIEGGGASRTHDAEDEAHEEDGSDPVDATTLARLEEALAGAEEQVTAARVARRAAQDAAETTTSRARAAEQELTRVRELLARAETEAQSAAAEQEEAQATLAEADATLTLARELRDQARATLEEAEDSGREDSGREDSGWRRVRSLG